MKGYFFAIFRKKYFRSPAMQIFFVSSDKKIAALKNDNYLYPSTYIHHIQKKKKKSIVFLIDEL
jgi:hypothetical protein